MYVVILTLKSELIASMLVAQYKEVVFSGLDSVALLEQLHYDNCIMSANTPRNLVKMSHQGSSLMEAVV